MCNGMLAAVKRDLRAAGIKIPQLVTIRYKSGNNTQYDVWDKAEGHKAWISAYNAAEAKYKYLATLLKDAK
jgi:hypothetical protein